MEIKQKTMGEMADVLKKIYARDLFPVSPKKNDAKQKNLSPRNRLFILVGTLVAVVFAAFIVSYNQIITYREAAYANKGRVMAEMQRRNNLFNNLVELYLSYTNLEKEIFNHIAEVRSQVKETQALMDKIKKGDFLGLTRKPGTSPGNLKKPVESIDTSLSQLLAVVEQYPSLRSAEPHKALIANLVVTENRIATERGRLNMSVRQFNNMIAKFPYKFMAWILGFERFDYFETPVEIKLPPKLGWKQLVELEKRLNPENKL